MRWKPAIAVSVNGQDVSGVFLPRVASITITDTAGLQSDSVDIVLTDANPLARLAIPPTGAEVVVALGYGFPTSIVGTYVVDEVEVDGPPDRLRLRAFASTHGAGDGGQNPISEQRTRSWPDGTTVATLVETIAGEAGFTAAVSAAAGEIVPPHIDQIAESDMALLTRIARDNGLVFKPGGGALVMVQAGESTSANGEALPVVALQRSDVSRWAMRIARREPAATVVASWHDTDAAETVDVEATGNPGDVAGVTQVRRLRRPFADEASAQRAAQAEADRGSRAAKTLTLNLPGRADLTAEGRLDLTGFRPGVDGEWLIRQVVHQIDAGGWRSTVEAELPPA